MENKALKKILVMAIVFVMVFSNCGFTLQALATSDGISIFGFTLFGKDRLNYKAYFLDENGKEVDEMEADVNGDMTLVLELEPKETGYLRTGTIKAVTDEGEPNFKFKEILNLSANKEEEKAVLEQTVQLEQTLLKTEQVMNTELPKVELSNPFDNANENVVAENTVTNTVTNDTNTVATNQNTVQEENTVIEEPVATSQNLVEDNEDALVDEEVVYEEEAREKEETVVRPFSSSSAKVVSDDEILIENVVDITKVYIKIAYNPGEKVKAADLCKETSLDLVGIFISKDLEEKQVTASDKITAVWKYSKDILVSSEIGKVAPFEVEGTKGTIVESKVLVNRTCEEENYLPIKETVIELVAPKINGKAPVALDVSANKLKATAGEEINEISFSNNNWNYDANTNTITIKVENPDGVLTSGEDIYVVVYRYEDYVESEEITVDVKGTVTVEEYSGKENNKITKEFSDKKVAIVNIGELVTYSIGTTEDLINRGKINANYNSVEAVYETEFTSTVSMNILTNDILKEFTLKDTKEYYIDKSNLEFEAQDVKYKTIKFKYDEIAEILNQGGTIEIKANTGELLYTLNSDLVKSQPDCEVILNGDVHGVEISIKDISVNGTITVDFVKSIGKCAYEKFAFNNFEKIESRVKAEIKYGSSDEVIELTPLKTEKYFEKSYTRAEISMNKDSLSTILDNENVEFKIELNNNSMKSDLYINPEFEVVFPSYVQQVEVKAVNLVYEEGLTVKNISLFKDNNNIQRMKIELEGVQRTFSSSDITNGTNIIVNTKIVVDDYTPRKVDQLKMYYYNQGVTNYQSQTDWKISSPIPDGIIKTTNGFDVEVFEFQAPTGFVTANGIENYDGLGSVIETIKQGEVTAKAEMGETPRVVTMTLAALNNTGNKCTDVLMLGRIPHTEATDVITGLKLPTNRNTTMVSGIFQADSNPIGCDIYYSYKADARKGLGDGASAWTKTPEDMSQVKSFLIVPTSEVAPGTAFKFSYNVQIPANLPYEVSMFGSFGAYYNNHSELDVMYESTKADPVGLVTDAGPKVEAVMSVDIGDGADILEERMMTYTLTVKNTGSIDLTNVDIVDQLPNEVHSCGTTGMLDITDNGYIITNTTKKEWHLDTLKAGEIVEKSFVVRTSEKPETFEEYASMKNFVERDDRGFYQEDEAGNRTYLTEMPTEMYIENKAVVTIENLGTKIETNTVKNKWLDASFNIKTALYSMSTPLISADEFEYVLYVQNISNDTMKNIVIEDKLPKEIKFISIRETDKYECNYDESTNTLKVKANELEKNSNMKVYAKCQIANMKNISEATVTNQIKVYADGVNAEVGTKVVSEFLGPKLSATQESSAPENTVKEYDPFNIIVNVKNTGKANSQKAVFQVTVPNEIEIMSTTAEGNRQIVTEVASNVVKGTVNTVDAGKNSALVIKARPKLLPDDVESKTFTVTASVVEDFIGTIEVNALDIKVVQNPANPVTDEQKKEEEEKHTITTSADDKDFENSSSQRPNSNNSSSSNKKNNLSTANSSNQANNQNNDNNNNNQNNNNNNNSNNENTNNEANNVPNVNKVKITGEVWLDANKNSSKDESEKPLAKVQVSLQKNGKTLKAVTTDSTGKYRFEDIDAGKYSVVFEYDAEKYIAATYKADGVSEEQNSDALELKEGYALSNNVEVLEGEAKLNLGLQDRDTFDIQIAKYITKAVVKTNGKEKVHEYKDLDLAKLDIRSKELRNTDITLTYKVVVKNAGNVKGKVETIVDYLPSSLTFDESKNQDWKVNSDGTVYNKSLSGIELNPKEEKELILVLDKKMTEDNTGVISNKVEAQDLSTTKGLTEISDNNSATQEMIISVSTGRTFETMIIIIFILAVFAGLGYNNKLPININFNFNKTYKSKNKKISLKKFYK